MTGQRVWCQTKLKALVLPKSGLDSVWVVCVYVWMYVRVHS